MMIFFETNTDLRNTGVDDVFKQSDVTIFQQLTSKLNCLVRYRSRKAALNKLDMPAKFTRRVGEIWVNFDRQATFVADFILV